MIFIVLVKKLKKKQEEILATLPVHFSALSTHLPMKTHFFLIKKSN
jgi:hypothetical protein